VSERLAGAALVGLLVISLPACSARSSSGVATPTTDISAYSTLAVAVDSTVADSEKEKVALASEIMVRVKPSGRFKEVRPAAARETKARTLLLKATITKVKKVGGTKRFMLGVGAGRANVSAQVNLSDARTGKELGSYSITGESGGSAFAGGTEDAVKKAAEQVVAVLLGAPPPKKK
jgi:hypothetical protein